MQISAKAGEKHTGSQELAIKVGGPICKILAYQEAAHTHKAEAAFTRQQPRHLSVQATSKSLTPSLVIGKSFWNPTFKAS